MILSAVGVAAGIGIQAVAKEPGASNDILAINNAMVDTLEQWKAKPWASMTSQTDTVTINGKSYTRTITVAAADPASPESGGTPRADFNRITVQINGQTMGTYVINP